MTIDKISGFQRSWFLPALLCVALFALRCSLLVSLDSTQCRSDQDCVALGVGFERTVCTPQAVCEAIGPDGSSPSQCSNSACSTLLGEPATCHDNECVKLASVDCIKQFGASADDTAFLMGAFAPLSNQSNFTPIGKSMVGAWLAALQEYNQRAKLTDKARPARLVICDEVTDPARAARHLIDDLGVPIILGGYDDRRFEDLIATARTSSTILIGSFVSDPVLTDVVEASNPKGRIWSVRPNRTYQLKYFAAELNAALTAFRQKAPSQLAQLKVALVVDGNASSTTFGNRADPIVSAALATGDSHAVFNYGSAYDQHVNYSQLAAQIIAFGPNVVLASSSIDFDAVMSAVEAAWPLAAPRPFYLLWNKVSAVGDLIRGQPDLMSRILGADLVRLQPVLDAEKAFAAAYRTANNSADPYPDAELAYDAFYVAMYGSTTAAAQSSGTIETTLGPAFSRAISNITGNGVEYAVGAAAVSDLIGSVIPGPFHLIGASSHLNFDLASGSPKIGAYLYCIKKDLVPEVGVALSDIYADTGIRFDPTTGLATGTLNLAPCAN